MRLHELEHAFWDAVRTRGAPPVGLNELFVATASQSAVEQLAVYHRAYWQRQLLALASAFPRLQGLLGELRFERLALRYLELLPGNDPCIERLGSRLPAFLAEQAGVSPVERDVARLEWAWMEALLSPDSERATRIADHVGARLADCRLLLVPSLQVELVARAALSAFGAAADGKGVDTTEVAFVAVFRAGFAVRHLVVAEDEADALRRARGGATVGSVCEAFATLADDQAAARATAVLSAWFARGWIAACHAEGGSP